MPTTSIRSAPKRLLCRHIFTDGRRCGSPCLTGEDFCYYHHNTRGAAARASFRNAAAAGFNLPVPEDHRAVQQSIHQIIQKLAAGELDPRRAGLILYGLQIATQTLAEEPDPEDLAPPVDHITVHPDLGDLAPIANEDECS